MKTTWNKEFYYERIDLEERFKSKKISLNNWLFSWSPPLRKNKLDLLPASLKIFYSQCSAFGLEWILELKDHTAYGNTAITKQIDLTKTVIESHHKGLGNYELVPFWYKNTAKASINKLKKLVYFDNLSYGNFILLNLDQANEKLFLYNNYLDSLHELCINLEEYFILIQKTKGLYLWQQYFVKDHNYYSSIHQDDFPKNLQLFFPKDYPNIVKIREKKGLPAFEQLNTQSNIPKSTIDYKAFFSSKQKELKKIEGFKKVKFNANPPLHLGTIRKVEHVIGKTLPENIKSFYRNMNGFHLKWEFHTKEEKIKGEIKMMPLEYAFGGTGGIRAKIWDENIHHDLIWTDGDVEFLAKEELAIRKHLKPFEHSDTENMSCFSFKEKELDIYLCLPRHFHKLEITFDQYLHYLMKFLGLEDWTNIPFYEQVKQLSKEEKKRRRALKAKIKTVFPNTELSTL